MKYKVTCLTLVVVLLVVVFTLSSGRYHMPTVPPWEVQQHPDMTANLQMLTDTAAVKGEAGVVPPPGTIDVGGCRWPPPGGIPDSGIVHATGPNCDVIYDHNSWEGVAPPSTVMNVGRIPLTFYPGHHGVCIGHSGSSLPVCSPEEFASGRGMGVAAE